MSLTPAQGEATTAITRAIVQRRQLRGEVVPDEAGRPRVVFRTPNWEDFVHVACNEIRTCGADNVQVARRLRAMLMNLVASLPPHRHVVLQQELDRLDQTIERLYVFPGDLALARIPDSQGLGGSTGMRIAS
jgi:uncharacterized membrane protein